MNEYQRTEIQVYPRAVWASYVVRQSMEVPQRGSMSDNVAWDDLAKTLVSVTGRHLSLSASALLIEYDAITWEIVYASKYAQKVLGYDISGESTLNLCHPDDVQATIETWNDLRIGNTKPYGLCSRYRKADGEYVWIRWSPPVNPHVDGRGVVVGTVIHHDPDLAEALQRLSEDRRHEP